MAVNLPTPEELREVLNAIKASEGMAAPWCNPDDPKYARAGREFIEAYNEGLEAPLNYRKTNVRPIRDNVKVNGHDPNFHFTAKSLGEIQDTDYPDIRWIVPGIIPEGLTVISGPPKIGKSWLALNLCLAIGAGGTALGKIPVTQGKVLYLALEDSERRLSKRTKAILDQLQNYPKNIREHVYFSTVAAKLDNGLIDAIQNFLADHPDTVLIIIDTLAKVRPIKRIKGQTSYENDYSELCALQTICTQKQIGIAALTHNRKMNAEDVLEDISGSMGISGSADTILVMKRARGSNEAALFVTGRDIEQETTFGMQFDHNVKAWCITGEGVEVGLSEEAMDVIGVLKEHGQNGKSVIELARIICGDQVRAHSSDPEYEKIRKRIDKLESAGILKRSGKLYFYVR